MSTYYPVDPWFFTVIMMWSAIGASAITHAALTPSANHGVLRLVQACVRWVAVISAPLVVWAVAVAAGDFVEIPLKGRWVLDLWGLWVMAMSVSVIVSIATRRLVSAHSAD